MAKKKVISGKKYKRPEVTIIEQTSNKKLINDCMKEN